MWYFYFICISVQCLFILTCYIQYAPPQALPQKTVNQIHHIFRCELNKPRSLMAMLNLLQFSLRYLLISWTDWAEISRNASLWTKEKSLNISAQSVQPFERYQSENCSTLSMDTSERGLLSSHYIFQVQLKKDWKKNKCPQHWKYKNLIV